MIEKHVTGIDDRLVEVNCSVATFLVAREWPSVHDGGTGTEIGVHLHSTLQNWEDKLEAAVNAGCKRFDRSPLTRQENVAGYPSVVFGVISQP